jgi:hypothetical protein
MQRVDVEIDRGCQRLETLLEAYPKMYRRDMPGKMKDRIAEKLYARGHYNFAAHMYDDKALGRKRFGEAIAKCLREGNDAKVEGILDMLKGLGYEKIVMPDIQAE